ncbi:MAG: DUF805 domain-containing protein [Lactobacillaceae bacterium]|nr:DUF805 domain-containing protein [Lactobacillaceae bacterium]
MSIFEAYGNFWKHYADFRGRATRKEFWTAMIVNVVIVWLLVFVFTGSLAFDPNAVQFPVLGIIVVTIFGLAIIIPQWALIFRRVRDTGVKNVILWGILAIIINIISLVFGFIPTDNNK